MSAINEQESHEVVAAFNYTLHLPAYPSSGKCMSVAFVEPTWGKKPGKRTSAENTRQMELFNTRGRTRAALEGEGWMYASELQRQETADKAWRILSSNSNETAWKAVLFIGENSKVHLDSSSPRGRDSGSQTGAFMSGANPDVLPGNDQGQRGSDVSDPEVLGAASVPSDAEEDRPAPFIGEGSTKKDIQQFFSNLRPRSLMSLRRGKDV